MPFRIKITKQRRYGKDVWVVNAPGSHVSPSGLPCRRPRTYGSKPAALARAAELMG